MIFSTPGNNDYHYFTPYYGVNYSFTEQDIVAINYLQYSNINVIYTDNYYNIVLKYYKKSKALAYESNNFDMYIATGDFPSSYKYILLRNYINNNTFKVFFSIYHLDYNINDSLYYYNLIYSSNNNSIYLR
jgi:hypothetical protein